MHLVYLSYLSGQLCAILVKYRFLGASCSMHLCPNVTFATSLNIQFYLFVFQALEHFQVLFFYFEQFLARILHKEGRRQELSPVLRLNVLTMVYA